MNASRIRPVGSLRSATSASGRVIRNVLPHEHNFDAASMDHLEPNDSPLVSHQVVTAYLHAVAAALTPKTDRKAKAVATITCLASFECEWMLCLECSRSGHYTSYANTADQQIWPMQETKTITATKAQSAISEQLGAKLHEVFRFALLGTRHSETRRIGLDGVTYHFSFDHMSGKTWSPSSESIPGKLCILANEIYNGTVAGKINERRISRIVDWFPGNLPGFQW